jgi:hypothetical protein
MNAIALRYGAISFAGQVLLFFLMRAMGATDPITLILISAVYQLIVLYFAIRAYRLSGKSKVGNYLSGVFMGLYTTMVGALAFTIFINFYLNIDPGYTQALEDDTIQSNLPEERDSQGLLDPILMSAMVFGTGLAIGVVGSYIFTRIIDMNIAHSNTNVNATEP